MLALYCVFQCCPSIPCQTIVHYHQGTCSSSIDGFEMMCSTAQACPCLNKPVRRNALIESDLSVADFQIQIAARIESAIPPQGDTRAMVCLEHKQMPPDSDDACAGAREGRCSRQLRPQMAVVLWQVTHQLS